jgi:diguanylate cyclase (GGDEF)-like protein
VSKYILATADGRITQEKYRTATFAQRSKAVLKTDFDPRIRPWFKAVGDTGHRWTPPYIYFSAQRSGITVSTPVLNKVSEPIGVLGLDIEISNLSHFLSKNELSRNSTALIATSNKDMVAHTDFDTIMYRDPDNPKKYKMMNLEDIDDDLSKKSIEVLEATGKDFVSEEVRTVTFEHNNETYHAVFHSYNKLGLKWTVVITAPESDFIEMIRSAQRWQILAAVISSLVITLLAFLLALRFLRPVGELQESVLRNPLTGLYNRRALDKFGDDMVKEEHSKGRPVSVAMIDIDRFKMINDTYGHPVGDEVLVAVSQRMLNVLKKTDVLARYGGEEFALLMVGANLQAAEAVCERLRKTISDTKFMTKSGCILVTVSIGVEEIAEGDDFFRDALTSADQALYLAKRQGRNRVCSFDEMAEMEEHD